MCVSVRGVSHEVGHKLHDDNQTGFLSHNYILLGVRSLAIASRARQFQTWLTSNELEQNWRLYRLSVRTACS